MNFRRMLHSMLVITVFAFLGASPLLHADWNGILDQAEKDMTTAKDAAQTAYDTLQNYQLLVSKLGAAYSAKQASIRKGTLVTITAGVAAAASVALTGGVTAPTVVGIISAAANLGMAWEGTDDLLARYDEAIRGLIDQIAATKQAISDYNTAYYEYICERDAHLNNVIHSGSNMHGKEGQKTWSPNYDAPSFTCLGDCGMTFSTPISPHKLSRPERCPHKREFSHEITREKKFFQCIVEMHYSCDAHAPHHLYDLDPEYNDNEASTPGLSPVNGSSNPTVSPGDTHEARLITSEPYYYVRWYVKGPGDTSDKGTLVETDEGWSTGTETEARLSYTFASDAASGVWTITAVSERYSNLSQGSTRSYTVTVE